jgi:hypothetical protein
MTNLGPHAALLATYFASSGTAASAAHSRTSGNGTPTGPIPKRKEKHSRKWTSSDKTFYPFSAKKPMCRQFSGFSEHSPRFL